jgi:para-nitrobenzyl esterase
MTASYGQYHGNRAGPALSVDESPSKYVPAYAYEFNDENAPERYLQPVGFPYGAAHESEVQYLFSLQNTPSPACSPRSSSNWPQP